MNGTKRRAVFEPTPQPNDSSIFGNLGRSVFDGSKTTVLDEQRAAASQQHVRALNTQFASWIQKQLKDHPDELWEDGVRDYLQHVSSLLEKFSDVVKWLKENKTKGGIGYIEGSHILPKELNDLKSDDFKSGIAKTEIPHGNTTLGFSTPFVMPTFASKEAKLNSDNVGISQGNSVIFSSTPKFLPNFGSKEAKSNTSSAEISDNGIKDSKFSSSVSFFAANPTPSFDNSKFNYFVNKAKSNTSGEVVPDFASKDTKFSSSGSFFTANPDPSCDSSKYTNFGAKDTSLSTGFSFGNSTPSFGLSKAMPDSGSKEADINTTSTGFSFSKSTPRFGLSKAMPDPGINEAEINSTSTGFSIGNSTPRFGLSKAVPDSGSKEANNTISTGFFSGNSNLGFGNPKVASDSGQSYTPSWSSGSPFTFGNKSSALVNTSTSNDQEEEVELEQPSSPSLKKTQEEGIIVVHEVKCKLYVKSTDPADKDSWKDKGMGNLSIKCLESATRGTKESKPTMVVRNDVGRLLLNALIYPGIKTNLQKNSIVAIFHTSEDKGNDGSSNGTAVARTFLIRTKTEEDRDKLAAMIQECAPLV